MLKKIFLLLIILNPYLFGKNKESLLNKYLTKEYTFEIDYESLNTTNQEDRINFIILHYTATDDDVAKRALTIRSVSSHYLITKEESDPIYCIVTPDKRAWHAGDSSFGGRTNINDTSIGIEIVNKGTMDYVEENEIDESYIIPIEAYEEFQPKQIDKIVFLLRQLTNQYEINPKFIVGHGDIAPGRKLDPGPKFPWETLYKKYNIGAWYDEHDRKEFYRKYNDDKLSQIPIIEIKEEFVKYGYNMPLTNEWDVKAKNVIYAFQCHFCPDNLTGIVDRKTFAILKALNKKYPNQKVNK